MIAHYITYTRWGGIRTDLIISDTGEILGGKWNGKTFIPDMISINRFGRRTVGCKGQIFRLVWIAFNGPIPKGHVVHHIDHNKLNDRLDNLCLMTKSEHAKHHMKYTSFGKYDKTGKNNPSYNNHKKFYNNGVETKRFDSAEEAAALGYIYQGRVK